LEAEIVANLSDQEYLLTKQYHNANNLNARISLHERFSLNPYDWFHWVFDQFQFPADALILEIGCGPGDLWRRNSNRIRETWQVLLSDFSTGMLEQTRKNLSVMPYAFQFEVIDAQSIPYPDGHFDAVIANHMLYHVPDRAGAIGEIRRVLKSGGEFYATTIGDNHLRELPELAHGFDPTLEFKGFEKHDPFSLETGAAQLAVQFDQVRMLRYEDELQVTEAEPLVDYFLSGFRWGIDQERRSDFLVYLKDYLQKHAGVIRIFKDSGIFIAC
jgi:SAM-dependent methyltransferase